MRRKLLPIVALATLAALALAGVALAGDAGFAPATPASPNAHRTVDAYWLIFGFTAAIFVLVESALVVFVVRGRRGKRARDEEGPQIHGNTQLELLWTLAPVVVLVVIGGFVFYKLPGIKDTPSAAAAGAGGRIDIQVEGHRYYWEFRYPNGVVSIDRMRAPVGTVVALHVSAPPDDVIHSWWVPQLGGKIDAIPGHPNSTWFKADRTGLYQGQCAEFCGIQHAAMLATVEVMGRDEFDAWLSAERRAQVEGTSDLGRQTFVGVCAKCHGLQAQGLIGPRLVGNPLLEDSKGLETVVRQGRLRMPPVGQTWSAEQYDALYQYVRQHFGGGAKGGAGGR